MSASTRDVIIIGAGVGGLTCAVELARQGLDVLVLELHDVRGGYGHSFTRQGFTFDVSLHHFGGLDPGSLTHGLLQSLGVLDDIELHRREILFRSEFPDFSVELPNGGAEVTRALQELFPDERRAIGELFQYLLLLKDDVFGPTMDPNFDVSGTQRPSISARDKTFDDLLVGYLSNPRLRALLAQLWQYIGLPPSRSTANFSTCVFCSTFLEGAYHIRGGGSALAQALVRRLEGLGGECKLQAKVQEIKVADGAARGVELEDGQFIPARQVISGANPHTTFFDLVPDEAISKVYRYRLSRMESSLSIYSLYLGLDCPAKDVGIEYDNFFYNHSEDMDEAYRQALDHDIDHTDWCLTNYSSSDQPTAPESGSVVSVAELTPPGDWLTLDADRYREEKQRVRDVLFRKVLRRFPDLEDHVVVDEFATPRTMVSYTSNHDGAIYGFAQTVQQSNAKRLHNRSPIKNLWLTGAWTSFGGGYEGAMMTGAQTAGAVIAGLEVPRSAPPLCMHPMTGRATVRDRLAALVAEDRSRDAQDAQNAQNTSVATPSLVGAHTIDARVYNADVGLYEVTDASSLLRMMDRGRVEAIEKLCLGVGTTSWIDEYMVNVYRLDARYAVPARVGDDLEVQTAITRRSSHRAAFDHRILKVATGEIVAEATVEVSFQDNKGNLAPVPAEVIDAAGDDPTPLVPPTRRFTPRKLSPGYPQRHTYRVYFEDTDTQSIAYHVTYVRFCERALLDLLQENLPGREVRDWLEDHRLQVTGLTTRFLTSAVLGDYLEVQGRVREVDDVDDADETDKTDKTDKKSRLLLEHQLVLGKDTERVAADVLLEIGFTDRDGHPIAPPAQLQGSSDRGKRTRR